jgi:AraC family transcriptional regulator of adaptative response / DNA-3-methyladenine glycosylase II
MLGRMQAADSAYDGRFITGVLSTSIYCLPSCRARKPLAHNVEFFESPATAQAVGLRACLRCRPDDFYAGVYADEERLIRITTLDTGTIRNADDLARQAGLSVKQLGDVFRRGLQLTPAAWLNRERIDHAKSLLLTTNETTAHIAFRIGFESLSAFNVQFRRLCALTPVAFRQLTLSAPFELMLPPDYPIHAMLQELGRDPHGTTCHVLGSVCRAGLRLSSGTVAVTIELSPERAGVTADQPTDPLELHTAVLRMLGLRTSPAQFARMIREQPELSLPIQGREGLRIPLTATLFDGVIWAVLGQQISFKAACTLRRRVYEQVGELAAPQLYAPLTPESVLHLSPSDLVGLGLTNARAQTLLHLAQRIHSGALDLEALARGPVSRMIRTLMALPGIGVWSSQYLLLRAFGVQDALPLGDSALATALQQRHHLDARPTSSQVAQLMDVYQPHRSLATFHLWHSLNHPSPQEQP